MGNNKNQLQLFAKALAAPCWLRPLALPRLQRPTPLIRAENVTKMLRPEERKENPSQQPPSLNRNLSSRPEAAASSAECASCGHSFAANLMQKSDGSAAAGQQMAEMKWKWVCPFPNEKGSCRSPCLPWKWDKPGVERHQ